MTTLFASSELAQIGRFGLVGIFNTALDFAIFNILSGKRIGWSKLKANTASTTVAMIFSFILNRETVFHGGGNVLIEAIEFFAVTAVGLYVLQNGIIYLLAEKWLWPSRFVAKLCSIMHLPKSTNDLIIKNGAKAVGTIASLTWNYILYKRLVFR